MKKLINWCWDFYKAHKEILNYLICGGIATVINIVVYSVLVYIVLGENYNILSNTIAIIASVIFQYFSNKFFVFERKSQTAKENLIEAGKFFSGRAVTALLDEGMMFLGVDILNINNLFMKIITNIIVIILNYIISKFLVFTKGKQSKQTE